MKPRLVAGLVALELLVALGFAGAIAREARMNASERYVATARALGCPSDQVRNFIRAGIALQPKQLGFAAAARECDRADGPTEVGFGGARMGGKSHGVLSQMGADDCVRHPGLRCLFLRKVGSSARESFEELLPRTIGSLGIYTPTQGMFRLRNGSAIRLGHFQNENDIDKYLGLQYDVIAIEEATTLSRRKKEAIQSCNRSPVDKVWRARMYHTTNPGGIGHAWYKAEIVEPFRRESETRTRFVPATIDDNAFAPREYHDFLDGLTGWLKRAWRYGDWDIAAGQFFTAFRRDVHVCPASEMSVEAHWRTWISLDHGFVHWTNAYLLSKDADGMLRVHSEHAARRWLVERNAEAIRAMAARHRVKTSALGRIVAGGDVFRRERDGQTVARDYAANGLTLVRANDDRRDGAAEILRLLGDPDADPPIATRVLISDTCVRLIECLPSLEHDPLRPEDVLKIDADDDTGLGGDDAYDAFRYGVMHVAKPKIGSPAVTGSARIAPRGLPPLY